MDKGSKEGQHGTTQSWKNGEENEAHIAFGGATGRAIRNPKFPGKERSETTKWANSN
jgi:hypothetical protein